MLCLSIPGARPPPDRSLWAFRESLSGHFPQDPADASSYRRRPLKRLLHRSSFLIMPLLPRVPTRGTSVDQFTMDVKLKMSCYCYVLVSS